VCGSYLCLHRMRGLLDVISNNIIVFFVSEFDSTERSLV
jgi:hypothetical protein